MHETRHQSAVHEPPPSERYRRAAAAVAAACCACSGSGSLPVYTPPTVLPVTRGRSAALRSTAGQSRAAAGADSSTVQGWLNGSVHLISNVVSSASDPAGASSS